MITFHAVCYAHHRHADGTYPIKIKVTFKRVHRHLPTNLVAKQGELTRTMHIKSPQLVYATNDLIERMRRAVSGLSYFDLQDRDIDWLVAYIRKKITDEAFRLNFYDWCKERAITRHQVCALRVWELYAGRDTDINDITVAMLNGFVDFVNARKNVKVANTTALKYLYLLKKLYDDAKYAYNDEDGGIIKIPRSPFSRLRVQPSPSVGQKNLGVDVIQRIIKAKSDNVRVQRALDAFVISFALMGANLADLWEMNQSEGVWVYNRKKVRTKRADKAEMRVVIPSCVKQRIKGWTLHRYIRLSNATTGINHFLTMWAEENGVERFTFYAARHSWASIARSIGIEKATIDECLAHIGDFKIADIYAERNWEVINAANTKVLALFKW